MSEIQNGMQVTISRGKLAGQTGTVQFVDEANKSVALQTEQGLRVVNFSSIKVPDEPTVTKRLLEAVLEQARQEFGNECPDFIRDSLPVFDSAATYDDRAVN